MTPEDQTTLEATIVAACTAHENAHRRDLDYRPCISIGTDYFVKWANPKDLEPEIATQNYVLAYAEAYPNMPDTPRIPKVLFHFRHQLRMYMVMEYIQLAGPPPDPQKIADALRWLSKVPPPPNHVIGPLAGGCIRHKFFQEYEAPLDFSSVQALERYINKASKWLSIRAQQGVKPVDFSNERLMFMQPDMDTSNFCIDEHGNTVLVDFGQIAVLPESFAMHAIGSNTSLAPIAKSLGLSRNVNTASMSKISSVLWMIGDPTLGLNNDGYPESRRRRVRIKHMHTRGLSAKTTY